MKKRASREVEAAENKDVKKADYGSVKAFMISGTSADYFRWRCCWIVQNKEIPKRHNNQQMK